VLADIETDQFLRPICNAVLTWYSARGVDRFAVVSVLAILRSRSANLALCSVAPGWGHTELIEIPTEAVQVPGRLMERALNFHEMGALSLAGIGSGETAVLAAGLLDAAWDIEGCTSIFWARDHCMGYV
jgi:hypothetical protein